MWNLDICNAEGYARFQRDRRAARLYVGIDSTAGMETYVHPDWIQVELTGADGIAIVCAVDWPTTKSLVYCFSIVLFSY